MVALVIRFGPNAKRLRPVVTIVNWFQQDAIDSAIETETWQNNSQIIKDDEAVEILASPSIQRAQRVNSFVTKPAQKILDRYEFAREGGWVAYGCTIDGESAEVPYFKPIKPRIDFEKRKKIKYETPAGMPAQPLLPWVTWKQGLRIAIKHNLEREYRERFLQENRKCEKASAKSEGDSNSDEAGGVSPRPRGGIGFDPTNRSNSIVNGERTAAADGVVVPSGIDRGFYRWAVSRPEIPIIVDEGWKKALALLDRGELAIALRGVTCWHEKGSNELHEILKHFATPGRQIRICFDQDTKASTIKNVSWEIKKLGRALEAEGCNVSVMVWDPKLGKGVDDVIFAQGDNGQQWLDTTIATAPTFDEWSKAKHKEYLLRVWRYLESLGIDPERSTEGRYLPPLPELKQGAIHVVTAPTGSGKTTQLKRWARLGYLVVVLSPLNSLGKETAEDWGLPHRHDCGNAEDQQTAFRLLVYDAGGVVACIDSLPRLQEFIKDDTRLLLVLDECNQVLESLNTGGTLKDRQAEVLELFAKALRIAARNGAIVLSEARVNQRTVDFVKRLSGCDRVRLIEHKAVRQSWDIQLAQGDRSGFISQMVDDLKAGNKLICHVTGRNSGRVLDEMAADLLPGKRVVRLDSETNEAGNFDAFWRDPDAWLRSLPEFPDLLIMSPSAKSGVSITEPGFDRVYGYFTCHYPSMWMQMLARYRLPVPRRIWCPRLIPASSSFEGYCSSRQVQRQLQSDIEGYQRVFSIAAAIDDQDAELRAIQTAHEQFYADHATSIGIEKAYPVECLIELLRAEGHDVENITVEVAADADMKADLTEAQKAIWREDAEAIAAADPKDLTVVEAHEWLNSSELTTAKRWKALKVLWRDEFPGVAFDDADECYAALTENFGSLRRGVLLQVRAANLDRCKAAESEQVEAVLKSKVKLSHRLPRSFFRAVLIKQIGLLNLLDGSPYQESDDRVQRIKATALHFAREIYRYFLISIKRDQTGIEIANKLLRKLGLTAEVIRKTGRRGQQVRIWGISDLCDPIRVKLLRAAYQKMGGDPSTITDRYPAAYFEVLKQASLDRAGRLNSAKERSESWQGKTESWRAAAAAKVERLQARVGNAIAAGKAEAAAKLSEWLASAKSKLDRLTCIVDRASRKNANLALEMGV